MLRAKSKAINNTTYVNNRLVNFVKNPSKSLDVIVEKDEIVQENLYVNGNITSHNFYASGNYYLNNYILIPYGTIIQSAAVSVPDGWLNCNGAVVLRTTYPNLFDAIGYTYSTSFSGSDLSFNVPDLQGRVAVGAGAGVGLTSRNLGSKGGEENHTLTVSEMPSHNHGVTDPGHSHTWNNGTEGDDSGNGGSYSEFTTIPGSLSGVIASATTGISINNNGSGQSHNNMQPYVVLRYFIKY